MDGDGKNEHRSGDGKRDRKVTRKVGRLTPSEVARNHGEDTRDQMQTQLDGTHASDSYRPRLTVQDSSPLPPGPFEVVRLTDTRGNVGRALLPVFYSRRHTPCALPEDVRTAHGVCLLL